MDDDSPNLWPSPAASMNAISTSELQSTSTSRGALRPLQLQQRKVSGFTVSDYPGPASVVVQHAYGCHSSCSCCCPMQALGSHIVQVTGKTASWHSSSPGTLPRSPVSSAGTLQRRSLSAGTAFTQRALSQPHLTAGWANMLPGDASEPLLSADSAGSTASSARTYLTTAADTPQRDVPADAATQRFRPADAAAGAARLSAETSGGSSRSPSEYADTRSACMPVICGLSWRIMLGAHLALPVQSVLAVCAVSVDSRQCAPRTVSRSGMCAAGSTQTALCSQAPPAGPRLRHPDRGHPPWLPTSAGAVALRACFQLRTLGKARS